MKTLILTAILFCAGQLMPAQTYSPTPNPQDVICAKGGDTSITGLTCGNRTGSDATTETAFRTQISLPAGLTSKTKAFNLLVGSYASRIAPSFQLRVRIDDPNKGTPLQTVASSGGAVLTYTTFRCMIEATNATASSASPLQFICAAGGTDVIPVVAAAGVNINTTVAHKAIVTVTYSSAQPGNAIWISGTGQ